MNINNIFDNIPANLPEELSNIISETKNIKIERIVSKGQISPRDFWYDQDDNEFVIILKGRAKLIFDRNKNILDMKQGDYVNIPPHVKHRVEWTDPKQETVWLAVYY